MSLFRWWPSYRPGSAELGGAGPRALLRTALALFAVAVLLALPAVARVTGIPSLTAVALMLGYVGCMVGNDYVLHPLAMRSPRGFALQLVVTPLYNVVFLLAFVVIPGDPKTPLWIGPILYAAATGSWQEIEPSFPLLILHIAAPLATIPIFLSHGGPPWSIVGPCLCALLAGAAYHGFAAISAAWRGMRAQQQGVIDELRARTVDLERRQLARDLHDSVGSALALVGLYGDLIERHLHRPDELLQISATLRDAARDGLGELRGVLDAMAPADPSFAALAQTLRKLSRAVAAASAIDVDLGIEGPDALPVAAGTRLALVRIYQEALNNAVRHARPRNIRARLSIEDGGVHLQISDDGVGFDAEGPTVGRGVVGMRARAEELNGRCAIESAPGRGTRISLSLPLSSQVA